MDQVNKTSRGERTLGQHIEKLSKVIGNAKDVKNFMHKIPPLEAKQRVMDKEISSIQGKVSKMDTKLGNLEKLFKQMADNVGNLLKRNEIDKG